MSTEKTSLENENHPSCLGDVMLSGWQVCPKCLGQGSVSKPPYLAGDINQWSGSQMQYQCNLCNGKMIISITTGLPPDNH
jgi:hypothetical protein